MLPSRVMLDLEKHSIKSCRVMLDLETMDNSSTAAIVAIGAVKFNLHKRRIIDKFYMPVSLASSVANGGTMSADTVLWWARQSEEARKEWVDAECPISIALQEFAEWIRKGGMICEEMWGNGSDFDNAILMNAYKCCELEAPWKFWANRCYRTVKAMSPDKKLKRVGTHHNALDDAESQARHLMAILSAPLNK